MEQPWLKSYPPGVPTEINLNQYSSLVELLEESYAKYGERTAAICMETGLKFRDVDRMSAALAAWLQGKGLQPGARVAIMMPNVLQYMPAIAAILRGGFVVVNVNPLYTPRELEHQLMDSGAEAIFILENFAKTLEQVITATKVRHVVLASMGQLRRAQREEDGAPVSSASGRREDRHALQHRRLGGLAPESAASEADA
jgi:long-chain acyl-CoA synthetase